jgi:tetratricopeptide (TPR) repeat protein
MDALTNITRVYGAMEEPDQAIIRCKRYLKETGDDPEIAARVYHLMGQTYLAQENRPEAKKSYTMAIEKDPNFLAAYYMLARIYFLDEAQDQVIAQYEAVLEKDPNQATPHMMLGTIHEMQQRYDLAENHYRQALKINPEFAAAANNLAYILADKDKNIPEALGLAQMAKERLPDSPFVMYTLGWVYYKKG